MEATLGMENSKDVDVCARSCTRQFAWLERRRRHQPERSVGPTTDIFTWQPYHHPEGDVAAHVSLKATAHCRIFTESSLALLLFATLHGGSRRSIRAGKS